ncbi:uncharacterized protein N7483_010665 [Penicillium malachiteum]|uniref:uncharacterized protein n=1 Tax=Penicillium malachiteum TaxID=1324776 RepID=UPI002546E2DA|nr:uncharacterized protein N7483_010665 [Penicillium malachiteum]KAJ5713484.1 hypothetical protein N7483_010665 [Penicillium malachiteum]
MSIEDAPATNAPDAAGPANDGVDAPKSKRRRRPANLENSDKAKNQTFYFVDSNSSSKEKRAHVMRHHVQEKRKQRKMSHSSISPEQIQELSVWQARKDSGYDTDTIKEPGVTSTPGAAAEQEIPIPSQLSAADLHSQPTPTPPLNPSVKSPDACEKHPFPILPFAQNPDDIELLDYWTSKLAYWSGQNFYIKTKIWQYSAAHPVSFQAVVMTYCARYKAKLQGLADTEEIRRHVGQARKNIQDATAGTLNIHPDYIAMALAGLALCEDRYGNKQECQPYLDQAARIMRPRPGSNIPVEVFLHYVRFILPPSHPGNDPTAPQWLVSFLRGAENLMQKHSTPEYLAQAPQRRDIFQMESPLFSLLSSGPRPSQVPYASRMYVVPDPQTQEVSRTAALIYITAALWDFKDSADKTARFMIYLKNMVEEHQLGRHPACETLLWVLLEQGCEADLRNPERAWSTGELLKTHRFLRPDLQFNFNEILMSFLTLRPPIRGIDVFQEELQATYQY